MASMEEYRSALARRYWQYLESRFPGWQQLCDLRRTVPGRRPVFLFAEAWRNVIVSPSAGAQEKNALLALIPTGDRHVWFRSFNSSQALAQSLLGNLAVYGCLPLLAELQTDEGEAFFGEADVSSENFSMELKVGYLNEPRPTKLDAYLSGPYRVAMECKLTEEAVGTCSRPRLVPTDPTHKAEHCSGDYTRQRGRKARCSLTEIGVDYWTYVPSLFRWSDDADLVPCPLRDNYQLVRNVLAVGVDAQGTVSPHKGHVVVIYDERSPAFRAGGRCLSAYEETRSALRQPSMLRKCSWQRITRHLRQCGALPWLTGELERKYGL